LQVKYGGAVVTSYKTEFVYTNVVADGKYSNAAKTEISGTITLFAYKDNVKIADVAVKLDTVANELKVLSVTPGNYDANAFPAIGTYTNGRYDY
jgi:hypothetical protein